MSCQVGEPEHFPAATEQAPGSAPAQKHAPLICAGRGRYSPCALFLNYRGEHSGYHRLVDQVLDCGVASLKPCMLDEFFRCTGFLEGTGSERQGVFDELWGM